MEHVNLPKTKRGERTLKKICKAAEILFSQKGYYETEINDITNHADVATGTFYIYFPNKRSIFLHLMDELGHELRLEIRKAKEALNPGSFVEMERVSCQVFFAFVQKHYGLFRIVWQAQFVDEESFKYYYERFSSGYIKEIKTAQESGEIHDFEPALISFILIGIHTFVALKQFMFDETKLNDEIIDQVSRFIANGLSKRVH